MTTIGGTEFHNIEIMKYWQPPASWTNEKKTQTVKSRIFSGEWIGARKYDGAFYRFTKYDDGTMELLGRSKGVGGDYINKIDNVPHLMSFFEALPNGTCILGEIVYVRNEGSKVTTTIMGCLPEKAVKRQKDSDYIDYYMFDLLAYNGESFINRPIEERVEQLHKMYRSVEPNEYALIACYYEGERLWDKLQDILANGGEGIVMTKKDAVYECGKRPSKTTQKVKREILETIDCVIIGANAPSRSYTGKEIKTWKYWLNTLTGEKYCDTSYSPIEECTDSYLEWKDGKTIEPITKNFYLGMAGSLKIGLYKDGKLEHFGDLSGLTEEILLNWKDYVGKVCEVGGMQIDEVSGKIRHPKLIGIRDDKNPEECLWEQVL